MAGRRKLKSIAGKCGFALSLLALVSPAILVFLWMLSLSLKNDADNTAFPPIFIPNPPTLDNFRDVFAKNNFLLYLWNSILVTGGAVLVGLLVGVPAGYGIARAKSAKFAFLILIARITPALSYLIPLFLVFQLIGLNGTITALLVTHLVITVPIIVWVMIGYFENVPMELEDAALVDGASPWQGFRHIALPLAQAVVGIFNYLAKILSSPPGNQQIR
jgi:multiple sugar transport system permease protein